MRLLGSLTFLALSLVLPGQAFASDVTAEFESETAGWAGPPGAFLDPTGGVGGSGGFHTIHNDFGITFRNSANPAFVGDFTAYDEVTISIDLNVVDISFFGSPAPRPWLLELRDYDLAQGGYPWTSVWYLFEWVSPSTHSGWTTFSVTITDPSSTTLPSGWEGYGDEDLSANPILPPGVTFADVLAGVDEIAYTTLQPGWAFGSTDFNLVIDNVSIDCTSEVWVDLGGGTVGANGPDTLVGTGTLVGGTPMTLTLSGAPANALTLGWASFASMPQAYFDGVIHAIPFSQQYLFVANGLGEVNIAANWTMGIPPGTQAWIQFLVSDPSVLWDITLSNGLKITTP
jgi:hypothetical protein